MCVIWDNPDSASEEAIELHPEVSTYFSYHEVVWSVEAVSHSYDCKKWWQMLASPEYALVCLKNDS